MTLNFSLTVSHNLQIFGFFPSLSRIKNSICTSGVNDFYPLGRTLGLRPRTTKPSVQFMPQ
jgi:hypothetical protein